MKEQSKGKGLGTVMAIMIPDKPMDNGSPGENKVYHTLKEKLSDDWTVIHSFRWVKYNPIKGRKAQGEGDFVIFNRKYGILVLEVKGGGISYSRGKWYSIDLQGQKHLIQDPEKQANDTKYQIIDRLKSKGVNNCYVFHAVWFPDTGENDLDEMPANLDNQIILNRLSHNNPELDIIQAYEFWYLRSNFKKRVVPEIELPIIMSVISARMTKLQVLSSLCDTVNETYVRANNEQVLILESLENFQRLSIKGRAGTGKTILAMEKAKRDSKMYRKVLLLCFNAELCNQIKLSLNDYPNISVHTIHSYALGYLKCYHSSRVLGVDVNMDFDYLLNEFLEVAPLSKEIFDSIIVDEGQDFKPSWIEALRCLTTDEGNFYIFYDPYQEVYSPQEKLDESYLIIGGPYLLNKNMRNTDEISQSMFNILSLTYSEQNFSGIHGKLPDIIDVTSGDLAGKLKSYIYNLTNVQLIDKDIITVVTLSSQDGSKISNYDLGVQFSSVRRFKGLENDVIIIVDADLSHIIDPVKKRLLYVALSRARVHAAIFIDLDGRYKDYIQEKLKCSSSELLSSVQNHIIKGGAL